VHFRKLTTYLFISFGLHALLIWFAIHKKPEQSKPKQKVVQVSLIHLPPKELPKPKTRKTVVEAMPDANNQVPTEPANLAETNNSVKEETLAPMANEQQPSQGAPRRQEGINLFPDRAISGVASGVPDTGEGSAPSNNDNVEGVKGGSKTALNTVEFKYASFFNRVKRDIQSQWHPLPIIYREDPTGTRILFKDRWTLLYITLDDKGYILSIRVATSSGVELLDEEAMNSFRRCYQFPNPPAGLIADGQISFYFGFSVTREGRGGILW